MSSGIPIACTGASNQRTFSPLSPISLRRDDPNSFQEDFLQELIDQSPNVLPVREYLSSATTLFSLGREVPVDIGGSQGRIDNLLVTNDGYLVIVETKLYRNPEAIRDVITQTLQYGMAVGRMSLMELEARIKDGQKPALRKEENIHDCVNRLASEQNLSNLLADDFEEALEKHLRRGEVLLLVAADGIHVGVERVTHWLNEQGNSSPFKFGLVELKFYAHGNDRLVIPRTVLKTREVSRHVVVVDIRPSTDVAATAEVTDEYRNTSGGKMQESRAIKAASVPLTKSALLQQMTPSNAQDATQVIELMENYGFDQFGTTNYVQFGLTYPADGGDFHPLAYFGKNGIATYPLKVTRDLLGADEMIAFHQKANELGRFYTCLLYTSRCV